MKTKHKVNQIVSGIDLLLLGFSILFFTLVLIMFPEEGGSIVSPWFGKLDIKAISFHTLLGNIIFSILMAIIPIIAFEGSINNIKQGFTMRKKKLKEDKTLWARIGKLDLFMDIFNNFLFLAVFAALLVIVFHAFYYSTKEINYRFVIYVVTASLYLGSRKWLVRALRKLGKSARKGNPTYLLSSEGIEIKLVNTFNSNRSDPPPVLLRFDEIDELQVMTYREAENYLKYQIGPNLKLGANQTKDFIRYLKGEIPRPSVYTMSSYGTSTDKRVLFRGSSIFYLITFDTDDITDLLNAYQGYKSRFTRAE